MGSHESASHAQPAYRPPGGHRSQESVAELALGLWEDAGPRECSPLRFRALQDLKWVGTQGLASID